MAGKKTKKKSPPKEKLVIDEARGYVFNDEDEIYEAFKDQISELEKEYREWRTETDIPPEDFAKKDEFITDLLQNPDEVWYSEDIIKDIPIGTFICQFEDDADGEIVNYIAVTYFIDDIPKFVFIHFPTNDPQLIEKYKRGELIFSKNDPSLQFGEETVDALSEGDEFAVGLYEAMKKLRSNTDIEEEKFNEYIEYREDTIEEPDEVWKVTDSQGHVLIRFIKKINEDENIFYIVTTLEEEASESQYLLFSFPTNDKNLLDRYRQGECLDAVSYTREESH